MTKLRVVSWLSKAARGIIRGSGFLGAYVFLVAMMLLVISDPILRYVVGSPIYWSNEVSTFLLIAMAFISFAFVLARGKHIRVLLIFNRLPRKVQNVLWIIITLVGLFITSLLCYSLLQNALISLELGATSETAEIDLFYWQLLATIGMAVFTLAFLVLLIKRIAICLGHVEEKEVTEEEEGELIDISY